MKGDWESEEWKHVDNVDGCFLARESLHVYTWGESDAKKRMVRGGV